MPELCTIYDYMRAHAALLGERILEEYPALHQFEDPVSPRIQELLRKPFPAQTIAIMGVAKRWQQARTSMVVAECGTGKTLISLGAIHVHSRGDRFTALAMVPPHLIDCISVDVDRMQRNFELIRKQVEAWQRSELTDVRAKVVIYEAFVEGKLEAPKHLARTVHDLYFEPKYEEFRSRTIWSLSNAFTSAFKELEPIPQFQGDGQTGGVPGRTALTIVLSLSGRFGRPFDQRASRRLAVVLGRSGQNARILGQELFADLRRLSGLVTESLGLPGMGLSGSDQGDKQSPSALGCQGAANEWQNSRLSRHNKIPTAAGDC